MKRVFKLWKYTIPARPVILLALLGLVLYLYLYVPPYEKYYERGLRLLVQKQYDRAATEFQKAISEAQEDGGELARNRLREAYVLCGEVLDLHLGRYARAVEVYHEAAVSFAHEPVALMLLKRSADIYLDKLSQPQKAIEAEREILKEFADTPEAALAKVRIVRIYLDARDYEQAVIEARNFLAKPPHTQDAVLLMLLGDALSSLERFDEAMETFVRVEEKFPKSEQARLARFEEGNCLVRVGQLERALTVFEDVLSVYPNPEVVRLRIKDTKARLAKAQEPESDPDIAWDENKAQRLQSRKNAGGKISRTERTPTHPASLKADPFPDKQ